MTNYDELVKRLISNAPLPICPFDKRSPEYWTTPNDKPCKFCGGEPEGPDKCTGADTRIMTEAADAITRLQADLKEAVEAHKRVVERSHNDPLGTSKVIDMRTISAAIVAKQEKNE